MSLKRYYMSKQLFSSILKRDYSVAEELLQRGAQPDFLFEEGSTSLHVAAGLCENLTSLLLNYGANPDVRCAEGVTPLHVAAMQGQCEVVRLLLQREADPWMADQEGKDAFDYACEVGCHLCMALMQQAMVERASDATEMEKQSLPTKVQKKRRYTEQIQVAFNSFDPGKHFIDVTSPDHPQLLLRSDGDQTVINKRESVGVAFKTNGVSPKDAESSDSFHSCSSGSSPELNKTVSVKMSPAVPDISEDVEWSPEVERPPSLTRSSSDSLDLDLDIEEMPTVVSESEQENRTIQAEKSVSSDRTLVSSIDLGAGGDAVCWNRLGRRTRSSYKMQVTDDMSLPLSIPQCQHGAQESELTEAVNKLQIEDHVYVRPDMSTLPQSAGDGLSFSESEVSQYTPLSSTRNSSLAHIHIPPKESIWKEDSFTLREILLPVDECSVCSLSVAGSVCSADSEDTVLYRWRDYSLDVESEASCVSVQSIPDMPADIRMLSDSSLRTALLELGDAPGPVTPSTRSLYECRFAKLRQNPGLVSARDGSGYNSELAKALAGELDYSVLSDLEIQMETPFASPAPHHQWREGTKKASFNYLLLDPRVTKNLPSRVKMLGEDEAFRIFIRAIFYVGKGARGRPYKHFKEAVKHVTNPKSEPSSKVQHILEIWQSGEGVVSLHIFQNVIPVEAYTREACMIDCLGLSRLTNMKAGDYYGIASTWNSKKRKLLGVRLLRRAFKILLHEGERQIRPADLQSN